MSAAPSDRPPICLLEHELADVTGSPVVALQLAWLDQQRWPYVLSRKGKPKVARAYFEMRLGVRAAANDSQAPGPDWSADAPR